MRTHGTSDPTIITTPPTSITTTAGPRLPIADLTVIGTIFAARMVSGR